MRDTQETFHFEARGNPRLPVNQMNASRGFDTRGKFSIGRLREHVVSRFANQRRTEQRSNDVTFGHLRNEMRGWRKSEAEARRSSSYPDHEYYTVPSTLSTKILFGATLSVHML
ncbi:hypothetical protein P5V15_006114 [Pogonomyrmex californicus]